MSKKVDNLEESSEIISKQYKIRNDSMGVGTVYLMISQLVFVLANYGIHIGLAYFLGEDAYGIFGVLMSLFLINRAFLNTGVPRAVSKLATEKKNNIKILFQSSVKLQWLVSVVFALSYIIFSGLIARFLNDPSLTYYIVFLGVMVLPLSQLSLYSSGFLNGLRMFKEQAIVKIFYTLLRLVFTFILVLFGFQLYGVLTAYFLSLIAGIILTKKYLPFKINIKKNIGNYTKKVLNFSIYISLASLVFTLLRNINVLFIKSMLESNNLAGLFTAVSTISNVPFMVFWALPFALLPSISKSISEGRAELTKKYISKSIRYLWLLLLPIIILISSTSKEILGLLYPSVYQSAASTLSVLIFSSFFISILTTLTSIIVGSGKAKTQLFIVSIAAVILIILNIYLIPIYGIIGSAIASLVSSMVAVLLAGTYVYKKFKAFTKLSSIIKISLSSLIIYFISSHWHNSGFLLMLNYFILGMIYLFILLILGEINEDDWGLVKKLLRRG